jgi:hypothetical protein
MIMNELKNLQQGFKRFIQEDNHSLSEIPNNNEKLNKFIIRLSKTPVPEFDNNDEKEKALIELKEIYSDKFRHLYSEIFNCMIKFERDVDEGSNLYNLHTNIKILNDYLMERSDLEEFKSLRDKVFKLHDHISLEYSRIAYWISNYKIIENQLEDIKKKIKTVKEDSNKVLSDVNKAQKEAENLKTSQVTVLGVFISILVGLIGQVYIIGQSFSNIVNAEISSLLLLVVFSAFCTLTILMLLLFVVGKFIDKDILVVCPKSTNCNECKDDCNILNKLKYKAPYLYWSYTLIFVLLLFIVLIYYIPWNNLVECIKHILVYLKS